MNTTKKLICLLLALAMLVCVFAGCNDNSKDNGDPTDTDETSGNATDDNGGDETTGNDETTGGSGDQVDDDESTDHLQQEYIFGEGIQEYRILSRASTSYEFESASTGKLTGVEQAVYDRNAEVMERCHIEISVIPQAGDWVGGAGNADFMQTIRNNNQLPTSQYELVATHQAYLINLAVEGCGWDITDLPTVEISKRWWSEAFYETANYNGAQYVAFGDIAYTLYSYMMVVFFNSQVAENYGIDEDFYDLALDGDWTFGKMQEYTKMVTTDMDAAEEDRTYGLLTNGHSLRNFSCGGFEVSLIPIDADGKHSIKTTTLAADAEQKLQSVADFLQETDQVHFSFAGNNGAGEQNDIFKTGRALFYTQMLGEAVVFKEVLQDDYGVMPLPKYDENQTAYHTGVRDTVTGVLVPYNVSNTEMAGTVLEMLSAVSYFEVTEAYYEETIKYKSFNNPKCVACLELIRKTFDPAWELAFSNCITTCYSIMTNLVENNIKNGTDNQIAGAYKTQSATWKKLVRDLYLALDKIEADRAAA